MKKNATDRYKVETMFEEATFRYLKDAKAYANRVYNASRGRCEARVIDAELNATIYLLS